MGFTLIELLAVIVILAIIALIATPIVVNIINDSKSESQKRSIDMYAKVLQQSIEKYLMTNPNGNKDIIEKLHNNDLIDYKGDRIECNVELINDDGSLYLEGCKVNGVLVDYTYGIDKRPATIRLLSKSNSINITNYTDGNTHEMYTFFHEATEQTPELTDYRYIGEDPYNYVEFNNEMWRILGIFETETEDGKKDKRIKIMRNEKLLDRAVWNSNKTNDWTTATLNVYLNENYYNNLFLKSKNMIQEIKYYLGGGDQLYYINGEECYEFERGSNSYNNRNVFIYNKIGLLYPSDFLLSFSKSSNSSWINYNQWIWTLSPVFTYNDRAYLITWNNIYSLGYGAGRVYNDNYYYDETSKSLYGLVPTVYLNSKIKIIEGYGTKDNPYKLGI